jgi:hypothetical protein
MKMYLLQIDNGETYEEQEIFPVGVYDTYDKAITAGDLALKEFKLEHKWYHDARYTITPYELNSVNFSGSW